MRSYFIFIWLIVVIGACNRKAENQNESAHADSIITSNGCCAPEVLDTSWYTSGKKAPIFSGLEGIVFPVSTANQAAQDYFNQGLMLSFAFNHAEAAR